MTGMMFTILPRSRSELAVFIRGFEFYMVLKRNGHRLPYKRAHLRNRDI